MKPTNKLPKKFPAKGWFAIPNGTKMRAGDVFGGLDGTGILRISKGSCNVGKPRLNQGKEGCDTVFRLRISPKRKNKKG